MDLDENACGTGSSKRRLARLSVDKKTDVVLVIYEGKKKMCEMCGHKVRYFTHFILKAHHEQMMPKRIYKLCGSKECQAKALKNYMQTYVGTKSKEANHGMESGVTDEGDDSA